MLKRVRTREAKGSTVRKILECSEEQIIKGLSKLSTADRRRAMYLLKKKREEE